MSLEIYPKNYSQNRPFFVEIRTENEKKTFQLFRANYLNLDLSDCPPEYKNLISNEVHPYNFGLEGELIDLKYPDCVTFWKEDFLKFCVNLMNEAYEKQNKND